MPYEQQDVVGTLGIAFAKPLSQREINPLEELPGHYGQIWTVRVGSPVTRTSTGELLLGTSIPRSGSTFRLKATGHSTWNDTFDVCWSIGNAQPVELPTFFDIGSWESFVQSNSFRHLTTTEGDPEFASDGLEVQLSTCRTKHTFFSYSTSQELNPLVVDPIGTSSAVAAVQAFYSLEFTYDIHRGEIAVSRSPSALDP